MVSYIALTLLVAGAPAGPGRDFLAEANVAAAADAWDSVVSICAEWERARPKEPAAPLCIAQGELQQDHVCEAEAAARRSLALRETAVIQHYLGVALFLQGRFELAEAALQRAVVLDPSDPNPHDWLGKTLAAQGQYRQARDQAAEEKRLAPARFGADDRLEFWTTAAGWKFPAEALRRHGFAGWLMEQKRFEEAIAELEAALVIAPTFFDCHYHLGWCHQQLGDAARAELEYRKAIGAYPQAEGRLKASAYYNLSNVLRDSRSFVAASAAAREAGKLGGERWYFLLALGGSCREAGDQACATDAYRSLLRSHEQVPEDVRREARRALEAQWEPWPGPEHSTKVSLRVDPTAHLRCEHGLMLMEQRRAQEAIADLEAGLKIQPAHAKCRADLAGALVMSGDLARAEQEVRAARTEPHTEVDAEWRGAAAMLLAQLLTVGPGRGADGGTEGLALLDEAAAAGLAEPISRRLLLRGIFCDWLGRRSCAIEAFDAYLSLSDNQPPDVRERFQTRRDTLKREAAASP